MQLFYCANQGQPCVGIADGGERLNFSKVWQLFKAIRNITHLPDIHTLQAMLEADLFHAEIIAEAVATAKCDLPADSLSLAEDARILVPLPRPPKIICIGRNYLEHARELNNKVPDKPMFFAKLPSALLPHLGTIVIPNGVGRVDHEIELAVVIGKQARRVDAAQAMSYVAGYTIANDVTARDMQRDNSKNGQPWTLAKGFDTFCPLGPYLVPKAAVADPHNLHMQLSVNGTVRQSANTGAMIFHIPQLIAYISQHVTLDVGDILCTGTPEGIQPLQPGDRIEAEISGLGTLINPVAAG